MTNFKVPDGTPAFQKGFRDGCSTSSYSRGNVFYRWRYGHKYDTKMIDNAEYRFGYQRGYTWCFQNVLSGVSGPQASWDRFLSPYGYDSTMSAGNMNSTWDGFFGGSVESPLGDQGSGFDGIFDVLQKGGSGSGGTAFGGNPLWAGGSSGQFFGQ